MPVYSATCYTTLSPSITVSLWAQNLPSENLILHQSVYVSQTDLIAVDCLPDFFCSSVFMVLFYFVLTFVIFHVWQTKLASCLVNFLTHGNIMRLKRCQSIFKTIKTQQCRTCVHADKREFLDTITEPQLKISLHTIKCWLTAGKKCSRRPWLLRPWREAYQPETADSRACQTQLQIPWHKQYRTISNYATNSLKQNKCKGKVHLHSVTTDACRCMQGRCTV